jgi:hypothetical protein
MAKQRLEVLQIRMKTEEEIAREIQDKNHDER